MGPGKLNPVAVLLCSLLVVFGCATGEAAACTTRDPNELSRLGAGRILAEGGNYSETVSALTARTERIDPLDHFRKYTGGYNITNKHYWSSTIFTGKYGYIIAVVWLAGGLVYSAFLVIRTICFTKKRKGEYKKFQSSKIYCFWPIFFGIFFTLLAIVASGVVLGGSTRFHSRAESIKNIIVETADEASGTVYNMTEAVGGMQNITELLVGKAISSRLNSTLQGLDDEADRIKRKAKKSMRRVNTGVNILEVVTIVTVSLNLIAIVALLASRPLRLRRIFRLLIIFCWLLTFLFWVYFGLYFFLNEFAGDTCAALDEYHQNPQNSTLSSILPCTEQLSANPILHDVGAGIHGIIDQVNANISEAKLLLPNLEFVCNPFSGPPDYSYQPENCSSNTLRIGDAPQVLKNYTCLQNNGTTCGQGEFISASNYNRLQVYASSIQTILDLYPGVERLVDCQMMKDASSEILFNQCQPLKKYAHMTWAALAALSTIMVALVLIWTIESHHDYKWQLIDVSVKPHPASTDTSEIETTEKASKDTKHVTEP